MATPASHHIESLARCIAPPAFDHPALDWHRHLLSGDLHRAIARSSLESWEAPDSDAGHRAITALFGLSSKGHSFTAAAHRWARFHEPQITAGLAHFLSSGSRGTNLARITALLRAVWPGSTPAALGLLTEARARAEEGRIDLALVATAEDGSRLGAIIEAKFGHKLTPYQLQRYRRLAEKMGLTTAAQHAFVVVAPSRDDAIDAYLRRNEGWSFVSWERLLMRLEQHLPADADDGEFRRFRRTVWCRAYE